MKNEPAFEINRKRVCAIQEVYNAFLADFVKPNTDDRLNANIQAAATLTAAYFADPTLSRETRSGQIKRMFP